MKSWIDIAVILAYLAGTTLFGCSFFFRKGSGDARTFMAGGGKLPGWAIALSIFATYVSSISFLAIPAKAYLTNWNALVLSFSIPFSAIAAAIWFVPFYRRVTSVSAYSFLEERFGFWARAYASGCFLVMQSVRSGMILFLLALLLKSILGLSIPAVILVVGVSTMVYSMMGGLQAVVWTDAVQGIILIVGAIVCAVLLTFGMPEENFRIDLSIARGLDYYTGTVYETTLLDHPEMQKQLGREARKTMQEFWNAEVAANRLLKLIAAIRAGEKHPKLWDRGPCSEAVCREERL